VLKLLTRDKGVKATGTVREYLKDYYVWDTGQPPQCPHCRRVLADGGQIGPEYAKRQRKLLNRFVSKDRIYDLQLADVIINDVKLGNSDPVDIGVDRGNDRSGDICFTRRNGRVSHISRG